MSHSPSLPANREGSALTPATRVTGAAQLQTWLGLAVAAWAAMAVQEILLFGRPTPYGAPYVETWWNFLFHALLFNCVAIALVSIPAVASWGWMLRRQTGAWARVVHLGTIGALALILVLDQLDNEIMRFVGTCARDPPNQRRAARRGSASCSPRPCWWYRPPGICRRAVIFARCESAPPCSRSCRNSATTCAPAILPPTTMRW